MSLKSAIRTVPFIGPMLRRLRSPKLVNSGEYWEQRYCGGGNSGAGSYNRLAAFKAEVLNHFVRTKNIDSIIEFGCGDGAQLSLCDYADYTGIDVSPAAVALCREKFVGRPYRFLHQSEVSTDIIADLTLSLDVVYHLVEDSVFEQYMKQLFESAGRWCIVYSSNVDRIQARHVRHREFTKWVERNRPDFRLEEIIPNRYPFDPADPDNTSFADFYVYRKR